MKPNSLYIKIFLSFIAILLATEILIFALFLIAAGRPFKERLSRYAVAKARLLGAVVEDRIKPGENDLPGNGSSLEELLREYANTLEARIWLVGPDGTVLIKTFNDRDPNELSRLYKGKNHLSDFGDMKVFCISKHGFAFYTILPIDLDEEGQALLHVLFREQGPPHPERGFGLGMLIIGGFIALLVVPVSRIITNRVKLLKESANRIAAGDLSHRVTVKGKDEIGDLGSAFNMMAEKLEQMIQGTKELTANVSHELRSPLARIRVAQELIQDQLDKGKIENSGKHLEGIREEIELLDSLIGRILALSRMDFQESPRKMAPLDLEEILNEPIKRFSSAMAERGLSVETKSEPTPSIMGDPDALKSAVSNILENSLKYTPAGGHVSISISRIKDGISLSVTNTHDPISEEELSRIFEPFHRLENGNSEGTGLGLAITKRIVERQGGSIKAMNTKEGLCFQLILPQSV
jgi:two-component system sensor histidine kinase CpxA